MEICMKNVMIQTAVRLPVDLKDWISMEAERNGGSQNSEIIRAIRERMDRTKTT